MRKLNLKGSKKKAKTTTNWTAVGALIAILFVAGFAINYSSYGPHWGGFGAPAPVVNQTVQETAPVAPVLPATPVITYRVLIGNEVVNATSIPKGYMTAENGTFVPVPVAKPAAETKDEPEEETSKKESSKTKIVDPPALQLYDWDTKANWVDSEKHNLAEEIILGGKTLYLQGNSQDSLGWISWDNLQDPATVTAFNEAFATDNKDEKLGAYLIRTDYLWANGAIKYLNKDGDVEAYGIKVGAGDYRLWKVTDSTSYIVTSKGNLENAQYGNSKSSSRKVVDTAKATAPKEETANNDQPAQDNTPSENINADSML